MNFTKNKYGSKGIDLIEKTTNKPLKKLSLLELGKMLDIRYDEDTDTILVNCSKNLLIQSENQIFISKNDTVLVTGEVLGNKGKLYQNPEFKNK